MNSQAKIIEKSDLSVALCQMTSVDVLEDNIMQMRSLINDCGDLDTLDLICFPENSVYMRIDDKESAVSFNLTDPEFLGFSEVAQKHNLFVHLGSIPLKRGEKVQNTSVIFAPDGSYFDSYSKIHLFDVNLENQKPICESDLFAHGALPQVIDVFGWKVGLSICYDLRFPELYLNYAKQGVDLITVPSAFMVPTGKAHWEVLLRARAIEAQSYVLAAGQCGEHLSKLGGKRATYGHSVIIDPWGKILEVAEDRKVVLRASLSKERLSNVRRQIPISEHRRLK